MRNPLKAIFLAVALLAFSACDDNTGTLGIHSDDDGISNSTQIFQLTTRSLAMDSVVANSTISYLGSITDPETGTDVEAQFAAQFYIFEGYQYPSKSLMVGDVDGEEKRGIVQCDSCEVRLYFNNYYGDANNPMKLEVFEMATDKILSEDSTYYTDIDLEKYLGESPKPIATRVFTPRDYNLDDVTLNGSSYQMCALCCPPHWGSVSWRDTLRIPTIIEIRITSSATYSPASISVQLPVMAQCFLFM